MSLEELISTYKYAAIAMGSFREGEMVLILGGFASHRDYLQLAWIVIYGFRIPAWFLRPAVMKQVIRVEALQSHMRPERSNGS